MLEKDKQILVDHYLDFYRMAYAVLQNESDVEDAVQEALAVTMARPFVRNPYLYCKRVLYNNCVKCLSDKELLLLGSVREVPVTESSVSTRLDRIRDLMEQLPQREREFINLFYVQGMTKSQIADDKEISVTMVRRLIARGEKMLRQQILELELKEIDRYE